MPKMNLMIEVTNRCNLLCPTCFSHQDNRQKKDISLADFKKFIIVNKESLAKLSLYNYGEPLLNKNIYKMIRFSKLNGARHIKIATNGMPLNNKCVKSILASGLDYISFSIDGATGDVYNEFRKNGDFQKVISNISYLVKRRNALKKDLIALWRTRACLLVRAARSRENSSGVAANHVYRRRDCPRHPLYRLVCHPAPA